MRLTHDFDPVFDGYSQILILGTFPSVKSREGGFYYHNPRNRFWKLMSILTGQREACSIEEKKRFLLKAGIALWDVAGACDIDGSQDSSIRDVVPNDIRKLLENTRIRNIYANGSMAFRLYNQLCRRDTGMDIVRLPSTSPANAAYSLEKLADAWKVIFYDPYVSTVR